MVVLSPEVVSGLSHLFRGVARLPTRSSHNHILGGRTDGHRDSLVDVDLVCGDGDVHVHVSDDTVANSPVALKCKALRRIERKPPE